MSEQTAGRSRRDSGQGSGSYNGEWKGTALTGRGYVEYIDRRDG